MPKTMLVAWLLVLFAWGCEEENEVENTHLPAQGDYVVFAWNDLGMHCLNPTYDSGVVLPPYNTVWAQVVKRGDPPQIVTDGLTVEYALKNNTTTSGKTDDLGGDFAQFWDHAEALFGAAPPRDTGLNLSDPATHNGLSGKMAVASDHFEAVGIPASPVDDDGKWNPYQVAQITVKQGDTVLVQTTATVPVSDELNCAKCHGGAGVTPFAALLGSHDTLHGTTLAGSGPVLCASCHGSPALGLMEKGSAGSYLSEAIHGAHASRGATCENCHPGERTKCNRSLAHLGTAADGNCTTCHGDLATVASSITDGSRVPWVDEPKCVTCHEGVAEVDTGNTLYRNAKGHGSMYCASCHGSPHAMVPSREASDNAQALQYQNKAVTIGSCAACHDNSHGEGSSEYEEAHGSGGRSNACNVCHTRNPGNLVQGPHKFQWKAR